MQPIGGVNEKIEGFFDICAKKGLTGSQGVIIPATNIKHLMLRWDVVHAAQSGQFNIYAVSTVDEALELLTDMEAGVVNEQGTYPPESFNGLIEAELLQFTKIQKDFNSKSGGERWLLAEMGWMVFSGFYSAIKGVFKMIRRRVFGGY